MTWESNTASDGAATMCEDDYDDDEARFTRSDIAQGVALLATLCTRMTGYRL